jgi:teichuronic acid exporter
VLSRQSVQFLVVVVLARLLTPEDFGIIALLAFFTNLSVAFVQGGLSIAIIQRQQTSSYEESVIFWWNLAASAILGSAIVLAGPSFAAFFDQPVLRSLVFVAAAQIILSAAGAVHTALLTRDMRFDLLTKASLFASLTSGAIAVGAAVMGLGVWALAVQIVALTALNTAALWIMLTWRPSLHFQFGTIRELFGFGAWVSVGNLMEAIYTNGIALLIGKLHGVRDLAYYNQAWGTQLIPSSALSIIVGRVSLPLFASNQHSPDAMRGSLRLAIRCVALVNAPAMVGLALLSDLVITVLFGPQWLPAAPVLSILALGGILFPLHVINLQYVLAQGQSATFIRIEVIKKALGIICVVIGSVFGVIGLAWSQVVYSVIGLVVNAGPARRDLRYGPLRQLLDLGVIAAVTFLMALVVYVVRASLTAGPIQTLAICTLTGAATYASLGWLSASSVFRDPMTLLISALARTPLQPADKRP